MLNECYIGDCIEGMQAMKDAGIVVQTCVTSPPYWGLRDYGHEAAYGLEPTLDDWIDRMIVVFRAVREILADDGTVWLNLGDSYASNGGPGWQGKNGQRADRRFTLTRDSVAMRDIARRPPAGLKPKDIMGQPWRVAFALQADGWYLRQDIVWHKPNPMPESVRDRCTKSHEYIFLLSKSERYYYDFEAMQEPVSGTANARGKGVNPKAGTDVQGWQDGPGAHSTTKHAASPKYRDAGDQHRTKQGLAASERKYKPRAKQNASFSGAVNELVTKRNRRSVWTVASEAYSDAHFATFPTKLIEPCILAGSRPCDVVLDPFMGSGTAAQVAEQLGRKWVGCEINPDYVDLQANRLRQQSLTLDQGELTEEV